MSLSLILILFLYIIYAFLNLFSISALYLNRNKLFFHSLDAGVIVIGGGHSGCEAASASARTGTKTLLITQDKSKIGELSCNPSIGGIGKGHIVKEVDALGGLIGIAADSAAIHYRLLNRKKGPAVRGLRVQVDRDIYKRQLQSSLKHHPHLEILEATVESLIISDNTKNSELSVLGVRTTDGRCIYSQSIVMTSGTFLRARCYIGEKCVKGGRFDRSSVNSVEPSVENLGLQFKNLGIKVARFKTGTPPRLDRDTIDWSNLEPQPSEIPQYFSSFNNYIKKLNPIICCFKTYTTSTTHKLVLDNIKHLPKFESGDGRGLGPRYCPSIATKVERFLDKPRHTIWLEPESLNSSVIFPNGLSGGFPIHIQEKIINSIPGLTNCKILCPAYDVEYDYVVPDCLNLSLETKKIKNLFLCGQICGTTGYEEAAAMGIMAGINAAQKCLNKPPLIIQRDKGYIGVLINDLITKGTNEPYRMFTSRAEFRLQLRNDNADLRLTEKANELGLISPKRFILYKLKKNFIKQSLRLLNNFSLTYSQWNNILKISNNPIIIFSTYQKTQLKSAFDIISNYNISFSTIEKIFFDSNSKNITNQYKPILESAIESIEAECKYKQYIMRQKLI